MTSFARRCESSLTSLNSRSNRLAPRPPPACSARCASGRKASASACCCAAPTWTRLGSAANWASRDQASRLAFPGRRRYMRTINSSPKLKRGGLNGPPFLLDQRMTRPDAEHDHNPHEASGLDSRIAALITPAIEHMGYELVRVLILGRDRPTVQVMADRADGSQISVEDCERISDAVSAVLDVEDPLPGAWNLEVSSAGIDRPLTRVKDWNRFSGHQARVEMLVPIDGRRRFTGTVLGATEDAATLRLEGGEDVTLPLRDIRRAKLVLTDALIEATATPKMAN